MPNLWDMRGLLKELSVIVFLSCFNSEDTFCVRRCCPTVCGLSRVVFTGYLRVCFDKLDNQADVDNVWEQEKTEASLSWRSPREKCS